MAKQLNVNVAVTADTSAAKAQLQELQNTLTQLTTNGANLKVGLNTSELSKAISDVDKLQLHLKNATNTSGTLDFTKLSTSIKASGSSLQAYGDQLLKLGPQGQKAFSQLTAAISKSEVPMNRMKGLLGEFGTVLGNTIKWQAASSAIHGMMGSIQHAFSYAKQLNESLTNIQIVTQNSDAQMAKFAESANKAAQRLNTTTTAYSDAALIYYQQGLSDKEVAARTETTIKMANASGQSAAKVSDQMTAIWNNFAEGSTNLEYYADVITALGAATASSSEEIATGLSKFAAVADTVGLSYENATAALATITATTRQSADSVGTGLRTLFARLQSLNLGETLDDGTTLTKYTKALDTIGVKVLDATGNMRSMDQILEDMGSKWQNLTDAQKTATAQTVGGVRQYTTLMALMENFDFYKQNQEIAKNSEGTVQEQADIYAKSWEASQKRVKSAMESIYSDLINDDFFIGLNDTFAGLIQFLDQIIDGFGGLKTLLPGVSALLMNMFSDKISAGMVNLATTLSTLKPGATRAFQAERQSFLENAAYSMAGITKGGQLSKDQQTQLGFAQNELAMQQAYVRNQAVMSQFDRQYAQQQMDRYSNLRQQYATQQQKIDINKIATERAQSALVSNTRDKIVGAFKNTRIDNGQLMNGTKESLDLFRKLQQDNPNGLQSWFTGGQNGNEFDPNKYWADFNKGLTDAGKNLANFEKQKDVISKFSDTSSKGIQQLKQDLTNLNFKNADQEIANLTSNGKIDEKQRQDLLSRINEQQQTQVNNFADKFGLATTEVNKYRDAIIAAAGDEQKLAEIAKQIEQTEKQATQAVQKRNKAIQTAQTITGVATALTSMASAANSASSAMSGIFDMANNGASFSSITGMISGLGSSMLMMSMTAKTLLTTFEGMSGPVGWIIAALPVVLGIANSIYQEYKPESDEEKIERLKTEAEDAETAAQNASIAYEDLIANKSQHNELLDQLDHMVSKTNEFRNALEEANAVAREIISSNGLLYGKDYTYDQNSVIRFNEGVLDNLETEALNYKNRTSLVAQMTGYNAQVAEDQYRLNQQRDNIRYGIQNTANDEDNQYSSVASIFNDFIARLEPTLGRVDNISFDEALPQLDPKNFTSYSDFLQSVNDFAAQYNDNYHSLGLGDDTLRDALAMNMQAAISQIGELQGIELKDAWDSFMGQAYAPIEQNNQQQRLIGQSQYSSILSSLAYLSDNEVTSQENMALDWLTRNYDNSERQTALSDVIKNSSLGEFLGKKSIPLDDVKNLLTTTLDEFGNERYQFDGKDWNISDFMESEDFLNLDSNKQGKALYDYLLSNLQLDTIQDQLDSELQNFTNADQIIKAFEKDLTDRTIAELSTYGEEVAQEIGPGLSEEEKQWIDSHAEDLRKQAENKAQGILNSFFGMEEDGKTPKKEVKDWASTLTQADWGLADAASHIGDLFKEDLKDNELQSKIADAIFPSPGKFEKGIAERLSRVDISSSISALVDLKALADMSDEVDDVFDDLYRTGFEKLGGKSGILASVFDEVDFQKEFKKIQKGFKQTGKIGMDAMGDLMDVSEDLADLFYYDVFDSIGAVADAFELYSLGAINDIASISDELWNALEAANSLEDGLQNAFKFMEDFNPSASITEIDDFIGKWSKDYFSELGRGAVGGDRFQEVAKMLWGGGTAGQNYIDTMTNFFLGQEGKGSDPKKAQAAYTAMFGQFDEVWTQVQKDGNLSAYWNFLLNPSNQTAIGNILDVSDLTGKYEGKYNGLDTVKAQLEKLGITAGKDGAIDISTEQGQTYAEFRDQLKDILGLSDEMADMYASELVGHSAGAKFDFQTAEALQGWESLAGKGESDQQKYALLHGDEAQSALKQRDILAQRVGNQDFTGMSEEQIYDAVKNLGTLTDAEAKRFAYLEKNSDHLQEMADLQKNYNDAIDRGNESLRNNRAFTEDMNDAQKEAIKTATKIGETTTEKEVTWDNGETGTITEKKDVYDVDELTEMTGSLEEAERTAQELGGTLGKTMSDGSILTQEAEESIEAFQQRIQDTEQGFKDQEQQNLGKNIFKGILDGIKELQETGGGLDELTNFIEPLGQLAEALSKFNGSENAAKAIQTAVEALGGFKDITLPENLDPAAFETFLAALSSYDGSSESATNLTLALGALAGFTPPTGLDSNNAAALEELLKALSGIQDLEIDEEKTAAVRKALFAFSTATGIQLPEGLSEGISSIIEAINSGEIDAEKASLIQTSFSNIVSAFSSLQAGELSKEEAAAAIKKAISDINSAIGDGSIPGAEALSEGMSTLAQAFGIKIDAGQADSIAENITASTDAIADAADAGADNILAKAKKLLEAMGQLAAATGGNGIMGGWHPNQNNQGNANPQQEEEPPKSPMTGDPNAPSEVSAIAALQGLGENGTIPVNIEVTTSMPASEIDHLADDFEDMSVKYHNVNPEIKLDDGQVQKVKDLKNAFNELKDVLEGISKISLPTINAGNQGKNQPKERSSANVVQTNPDGSQTAISEDQGIDYVALATAMQQVNRQNNAGIPEDNGTGEIVAAINEVGEQVATIGKVIEKDAEKVSPEQQGGNKGSNGKESGGKTSGSGEAEGTLTVTEINVEDGVSAEAPVEATEITTEQNTPPVEVEMEPKTDDIDMEPVPVEGDVGPLEDEVNSLEFEKTVDLLKGDSSTIDTYIETHGLKVVDLLLGKNGPLEAINALPKSHTLKVTVSVTGSNAFGATVSFATGGIVAGQLLTALEDKLGKHYALNHPRMKKFLKETELHYKKAGPGKKGYSETSATGGFVKSYVNGSANRTVGPGISLTAEEGPEIIWNKQAGYAYIVGGSGHPEFASLQPGDRIFNANDTRKILNYHRPKSNVYSEVKDPRELDESLFGSHAQGTAYTGYGPDAASRGTGNTAKRGGGAKSKARSASKDFTPERYHYITRLIQNLTHWYDQLKKARDRAYGVNIPKAIDREVKATRELMAANREYLKEIEKNLAADAKIYTSGNAMNSTFRGRIEKYYKEQVDAGSKEIQRVVFGPNGEILNYDEVANYWGRIAAGDYSEVKTPAGEGDPDAYRESMQRNAQHIMNMIKQYEDSLDKQKDALAKELDYLQQLRDLELEKITIEIETKLKFSDKDLDILQHYLDKLEDNAHSTGEAIANVGRQIAVTTKKIEITRQGIKDLFKTMSGEKSNEILVQGGKNGKDYTRVKSEDLKNDPDRAESEKEIKTNWNYELIQYKNKNDDNKQMQKDWKEYLKANKLTKDDMSWEQYLEYRFKKHYHLRSLTMEEYLQGIEKGENFHIDAKAGEELENLIEQLLEQVEDIEQYRTYAAELLVNNYEKLADDVRYQLDLFDHFAGTLDHLKTITELYGVTTPKETEKIMDRINNSVLKVTKDTIKASQDNLASLLYRASELQALIKATPDDASIQIYKEELKSIESEIQEEQENIFSQIEKGLQILKEYYDRTLEDIANKYEEAVSSIYGTTALLQDAITRKQAETSRYTEDYEKFYQLSKLERQIGKDIEERANKGIKNSTKLEGVLAQINAIRATGKQLSEVELDLLQKQYDIAKAQSDLEDARDAKSVVRLQRDRNGNWGYVYTAMEDEGREQLEQNLEDSIYEYQKALTEAYKDYSDQVNELLLNSQSQMANLKQQFDADELTEDEYKANVKEIFDFYSTQGQYLISQMNEIARQSQGTIPLAEELYNTLGFNMTDTFGETVTGMIYGAEDMAAVLGIFNTATTEYLDNLDQAEIDYNTATQDLLHLVDDSINSLEDYAAWVAKVQKNVEDNSASTLETVKDLNSELDAEFDNLINLAEEFAEAFQKKVGDPIIKSTEKFINRLEVALDIMNGLVKTQDEIKQKAKDFEDSMTDADKVTGTKNKKASNVDDSISNSSVITNNSLDLNDQTIQEIISLPAITRASVAATYANKLDLAKELVFRTLDLSIQNMSNGLGDISTVSNVQGELLNDLGRVEQMITLNAEFPNAVNQGEIEAALHGLINKATQYANRVNKPSIA